MDISLQQLRVLIALERSGNVACAASQAKIPASTIRMSLQQLERKFGFVLFDVNSPTPQLSPKAQDLMPSVHALYEVWGQAHRSLKASVRSPASHQLKLAGPSFLFNSDSAEAVAYFRSAWPEVEIQLRHCNSREAIEALTSGAVDVALSLGEHCIPGAQVKTIGRARLVLLGRRADIAAKQVPRCASQWLRDLTRIVVVRDDPLLLHAQQKLSRNHAELPSFITVDNPVTAAALVRWQGYFGLMSEQSALYFASEDLETVHFRSEHVELPVCLHYLRQENKKALDDFVGAFGPSIPHHRANTLEEFTTEVS